MKPETGPRTRRSTRPGCEWVPARAQIRARFVRGSHRGGAPTTKPKAAPKPVGAPAPGANGACPGRKSVPASFAVRTEAVLLQQKPNHSAEPVGAPAPGANGACPRRQSVPASFAVRTEAVLLQQNQKLPPNP